jgi:hypothetical protein
VQEPRPKDLKARICVAGTLAKERVIRESGAIPMRDFRERLDIGRDDKFVVALTHGSAHPVIFFSSNEDNLVWIPNDILAADVPNEESPIGKTDLIFRAEALGALLRLHIGAAQILDKADRRLNERGARLPGCVLPTRAAE